MEIPRDVGETKVGGGGGGGQGAGGGGGGGEKVPERFYHKERERERLID